VFLDLGPIGFGQPKDSAEQLQRWREYSANKTIEGDPARTLILFGGFGVSSSYVFEEIAQQTSERLSARIIMANLDGNDGKFASLQWTDAAKMRLKARSLVEDVLKTCTAPPIVGGFSTGSLLAASLKADFGSAIGGSIMLSTPLKMKNKLHQGLMRFGYSTFYSYLTYPSFWWWRFFWIRTPGKVSDTMTERQRLMPQLEWTPGASTCGLIRLQRDARAAISGKMRRTPAPLLVMHGKRDGKAPWRDSQWIVDQLKGPQTTSVLMEDSGHTITLGREKDTFNRTMLTWLEEYWRK
jgi:pimeloyl-ACP methyl ester carboxylesterase